MNEDMLMKLVTITLARSTLTPMIFNHWVEGEARSASDGQRYRVNDSS